MQQATMVVSDEIRKAGANVITVRVVDDGEIVTATSVNDRQGRAAIVRNTSKICFQLVNDCEIEQACLGRYVISIVFRVYP
jgi:hypothetical protein